MFLIPLWMVVRESSNLQILTCKDRAIIPVNPKKLLPLWRKGDLQSSLYIYIYHGRIFACLNSDLKNAIHHRGEVKRSKLKTR